MTSNIGSHRMIEGITGAGEYKEGVREQVMAELRAHFRPEFLNRVDETVLFKPLLMEQLKKIIDLQMAKLLGRLADRKIAISLTDAAKAFIAQAAYDPVYGARPLRRYLQQHIETPLARKLIGGEIAEGAAVVVDAGEGGLVFGG